MVFVLLVQFAVAYQIQVAVADAYPPAPARVENPRDHRATHAIQRWSFTNRFGQGTVRFSKRNTQSVGDVVVISKTSGESLVKRRNDDSTGNIAGGMAAHTVSHNDQRRRFRIVP